ncbi:kinase-like domain-containing protein [Gigaspora rosea]|uniref:Kinase-like domain-containing protein n=1 Tax=Gigaspora rosea TaxID=44941 RepID=A0A397VTH6_9GLOM|nr:kinase-like domain-containing protein [Gigaspora rosea]
MANVHIVMKITRKKHGSLYIRNVIEWIPSDRLSYVKEIGKGGFGTVSATWLDGIRKVEKIEDGHNDIYKRAREPFSIFKNLMTCKLNYTKLAIYGITQNPETEEYLMVFQYVNNGNLYKYLRKNFCTLTWKAKLEILKNISYELYLIHKFAGYIHADFHSGNILQDQQTYIADLGLSRKTDEKGLKGDIYGVMPYVAPEVLSGEQQFTQAADIYGFGAIMSEMTTGQRPFDGHEFNLKLAVKIYKGLRPEFAPETPKCYIELAEKCMNSDPQKRPSASDIWRTIEDWLIEIDFATSSDNEFKNLLNAIDDYRIKNWHEKITHLGDNEIKNWRVKLASSNGFNEIKNWLKKMAYDCNEIAKQFIDADKVIKSLPIPKHPDEIYTSKIISTRLISKAIIAQTNSAQMNLDITENSSIYTTD